MAMVKMKSPDGKLYEVDESEAAEAQSNGWAMTAGDNPAAAKLPGIRRGLLKALPAAGAIGAGLATGGAGFLPMVGASALGGAAGEGVRQAAQRATGDPESPGSPEESVIRMGKAGAGEGAAAVVGGALAGSAAKLARPLMRAAIRPTQQIAEEFPNVVKTALKYRVGVGGKSGRARATKLRDASAEKLEAILDEAKKKGTKFDTRELLAGVRTLMNSKVLPSKDRERLLEKSIEFLNDKGKKVDPSLLKDIKRYYQNKANRVYKSPQVPDEAQEMSGQFSREVARSARQKLETIPGVGPQEAQTQELIGLVNAIGHAERRNPLMTDLGRPSSYPIVNSPEFQSRIALFLSDPFLLQLLRQAPKAVPPLMEKPNR